MKNLLPIFAIWACFSVRSQTPQYGPIAGGLQCSNLWASHATHIDSTTYFITADGRIAIVLNGDTSYTIPISLINAAVSRPDRLNLNTGLAAAPSISSTISICEGSAILHSFESALSSTPALNNISLGSALGIDNELLRQSLKIDSSSRLIFGSGNLSLSDEIPEDVQQDLSRAALLSISRLANSGLNYVASETSANHDPSSNFLYSESTSVNSGLFSFSNAQVIKGMLAIDSGELTTIEQHNINNVVFLRSDFSQWLKLTTSENSDSQTSFTLFTSSKSIQTNNNGQIAIQTGNGQLLGLFTNAQGGALGWRANQGDLSLNASAIFTSAPITDYSTITATDFTVSGDKAAPNDYSGLIFRQNGALARMFLASGSSTLPYADGTFVIESMLGAGIMIHSANGPAGGGSIRFAVGSMEPLQIDALGSILIGSGVPQRSSIFTINSSNRGMLLPRMISEQRRNIRNPSEGLEVYDLTLHSLCVYNGTKWQIVLTRDIPEDELSTN